MKKLSYKKVLFMLLLITLIFMISTESFASIVNMQPNTNFAGANQVKGVAEILLGILQVVAVSVATIMLVVLAIKYMAAAPGEKAEVKKSLTVYAIGALVLFASAGILNLIQTLADDVKDVVGAPSNDGTMIPIVDGIYSGSDVVDWSQTGDGIYIPSGDSITPNSSFEISNHTAVTKEEWIEYQNETARWRAEHGTSPNPEDLSPKYREIYERQRLYGVTGDTNNTQSYGGVTPNSSGSNNSSSQSSNNSSSNSSSAGSSSTSVSKEDRQKLTDALKQWAKENPGKNCNIAKDLGPEYYEIYQAMRIEDAKNK